MTLAPTFHDLSDSAKTINTILQRQDQGFGTTPGFTLLQASFCFSGFTAQHDDICNKLLLLVQGLGIQDRSKLRGGYLEKLQTDSPSYVGWPLFLFWGVRTGIVFF